MLTTNPVPSFWKIPIPIKVSGLADESICFYMRVMEGSSERKTTCGSRVIEAWRGPKRRRLANGYNIERIEKKLDRNMSRVKGG